MAQLTTAEETVVAVLHWHKQWHFQFPVYSVDQERPSSDRKENSCLGEKTTGIYKGLRLSLKDYIPFLNENVKSFSISNIRDHSPSCPDVVPAAETHLYNVMNEKIQLQLPVSRPRLLRLQHNELCVYHMCEMHQRNVTSWCVLERVFVRGYVYLPSPLFLLLPDRPFVQKHRLSSVYFWGLLQAAPGFRLRFLPLSCAPQSPVSPQCLVGSVIRGFCLVFSGGLVERPVLCEQAS